MRWFLLCTFLLLGCQPAEIVVRQDIDILFCPADHCKSRVMVELQKADSSIYFMQYSFTDVEIANALINQSKRIKVQGLMERQRVNSSYNQFKYLKSKNINVRYDANRALLHNKVFIIDKETVITGSYNPTKNGNEKNNENVVIIKDKSIAKQYLDEFFSLWNLTYIYKHNSINKE